MCNMILVFNKKNELPTSKTLINSNNNCSYFRVVFANFEFNWTILKKDTNILLFVQVIE